MKAITKIVKQEFQPVELTLVFETKEELEYIIEMCKYSVSIPNLINYKPNMQQYIKTFLDTTRDELLKNIKK